VLKRLQRAQEGMRVGPDQRTSLLDK
jgi:hypothetical protein